MAYKGNQRLAGASTTVEFTKEQLLEYKKCMNDSSYFLRTYVKIVNVDKGLIPFDLYPYQEKMIKTSIKNRFVICKLPRQAGKTTAVAGMMLWMVLFNENHNIAILAHKYAQAREILARIQLAYEHLPVWLQQGVVEWNKSSVELTNGSKILASATSSSAIRGGSFNLIYLDEFAFVPNNMQESFFASVYPTISSGKTTKVLITSTPNGLNTFFKLWNDSEQGRNDYKRIDVHWSDVPGRDQKWKEETIRNTSEDQFRVEFECEFIGSSSTLIHPTKLRKLTWSAPLESSNYLNIYSHPAAKRLYIICVDVSRGINQDYSVASVIDVTELPYRTVAVYRNNKISSLMFPEVLHQLGTFYNQAAILIETNDLGQPVADTLHYDLEYEGVLSTSISQKKGGAEAGGGFNAKAHFGVRTTKKVKKIGCANLKTLVEGDKLVFSDENLINELYRFSQKKDSYEAEEGHDDIVMTHVLFAWLSTQPYFKDLTDIDIRSKMYQETRDQVDEQLLAFQHDDGREEENPMTPAVSNDAWLMG